MSDGPGRVSALLDEAHLWLTHPDIVSAPELLAGYRSVLSEEERERYRRFYFDRHRHCYLVAHALVRTVLSRYVEVAPQAWSFKKNHYGRPEIADPAGLPPLRFNLSHTDGLIACLVSLNIDCGVDVEDMERVINFTNLADRVFSPFEVAALQALPHARRRRRFFEYWTLKEAYIKARGMGLSLPLRQFSFHLDALEPIRISFGPCLDDDPAAWQFAQCQPTVNHMLAVALRRGSVADLRIAQRVIVPKV